MSTDILGQVVMEKQSSVLNVTMLVEFIILDGVHLDVRSVKQSLTKRDGR